MREKEEEELAVGQVKALKKSTFAFAASCFCLICSYVTLRAHVSYCEQYQTTETTQFSFKNFLQK